MNLRFLCQAAWLSSFLSLSTAWLHLCLLPVCFHLFLSVHLSSSLSLFASLSVCLSVCSSASLSICLFVRQFVYLPVCPPVCNWLPVLPLIYRSVKPSILPSSCFRVCLPACFLLNKMENVLVRIRPLWPLVLRAFETTSCTSYEISTIAFLTPWLLSTGLAFPKCSCLKIKSTEVSPKTFRRAK